MIVQFVSVCLFVNEFVKNLSFIGFVIILFIMFGQLFLIGQVKLFVMVKLFVCSVVMVDDVLVGKLVVFLWCVLVDNDVVWQFVCVFVIVQLVVNYGVLKVGVVMSQVICDVVWLFDFEKCYGVVVCLIGEQLFVDDEFVLVEDGVVFNGVFMLFVVFVILWFVLCLKWMIGLVFVMLFVGFVVMVVFGFVMVGLLNMILVVFMVLFVGFGVDFLIQYGVKYCEECFCDLCIDYVLIGVVYLMGMLFVLVIVVVVVSFFLFIFIVYCGVFEFGLIVGVGMFVVLLIMFMLLFVLLCLFVLLGELKMLGFLWFVLVDDYFDCYCKLILIGMFVVVIGVLLLFVFLYFDFNLLYLKDLNSELMVMLFVLKDLLEVVVNDVMLFVLLFV